MKKTHSIYPVIVTVIALLLTTDCKKEELLTIPLVATTPVTNITTTTATSGGNITDDGGKTVSAYGVCWGTTENPTTSGSKTEDGSDIGQFISSISDLTAGTTYHVRAYATNSVGTAYGADMTFTTSGQSPTSVTLPATDISTSGATLNGAVNANYLSTVVTFEYGTSTTYGQTATASQSPVTGVSLVNVSANITGLTNGTTYHFRVKTVNLLGTVYSGDMVFTTLNTTNTIVTDIDGNSYKTVQIGTQVWMAENLKTTKYNNGTEIPLVTGGTEWGALTTPAYCWYNNDAPTNKEIYGAFYNWYTINTGNLCPSGWHVPSDGEWTALTDYLGGESIAGGKLKETGTTHWTSPNTGATNESGFTALPGGHRYWDGTFDVIGMSCSWWSSTGNAGYGWMRDMDYNLSSIRGGGVYKNYGYSVRCLQD